MKISIILLIGFFLAMAVLPLLTSAISPESVTPENIASGGVITGVSAPEQVQSVTGLVEITAAVVKWIYIIFFIIAVMFILFAAFNYLTGGDEPEKIKTAHSSIKYAAIAIAVALLAVGLELIIGNFLMTGGAGEGDGYGWTWHPFK